MKTLIIVLVILTTGCAKQPVGVVEIINTYKGVPVEAEVFIRPYSPRENWLQQSYTFGKASRMRVPLPANVGQYEIMSRIRIADSAKLYLFLAYSVVDVRPGTESVVLLELELLGAISD